MISLTDQLRIMDGEVSPPSDKLKDLVHQSGVQYGKTFMATHKIFNSYDYTDPVNPIPTNIDASNYLQKMTMIIGRMFAADGKAIDSLKRLMITLMADSGVPIGQIEAANDSEWELFINDNIDTALERASLVKRQEKIAYDAITETP